MTTGKIQKEPLAMLPITPHHITSDKAEQPYKNNLEGNKR